jgi:signal transduction histidine kinase
VTAPRILVVEDERIVALHLRQQLINLGYEVPATVASGDQALREVAAFPPDLVLMDINLEGVLDGIETTARIRATRPVPVIYLTAYSDEVTVARASTTNPYGYLLKPFSERELHAMIQVALARCRSEKAADAAEKSRHQTEKMAALGELAASVAEDFDQLLDVIYGQLEAVGDHATARPELVEPIKQAFEAAIEKEKLIRHLLAFSGRQKLTPRTVSIGGLVTNVINQVRLTPGWTIEINESLPADLRAARIDPGQLTKALTNIALNARDAMPDGGGLTITGQNIELDQDQSVAGTAVTSGDYVLLTVSDTGSGMPENVLRRAFEPFFSTKPSGDGLGLSLVFGFIRQSDGHISINSRQGEGTTVRLWLPAAPEPGVTAPSRPPREATTPRTADGADLDGEPSVTPDRPVLNTTGKQRGTSSATVSESRGFLVPWQKADDALFAAIATEHGDVRYRLVVEPLPGRNSWDWTVWCPDDAGQPPHHGRTTSVVIAMAEAEAAARLWAEAETACGD